MARLKAKPPARPVSKWRVLREQHAASTEWAAEALSEQVGTVSKAECKADAYPGRYARTRRRRRVHGRPAGHPRVRS